MTLYSAVLFVHVASAFGIVAALSLAAVTLAWPKVALGALILIGPLGAVSTRRLRTIQIACAASRPNESEIFAKLHDPFLVFSMNLRIALVLGILLLMTAKPEMRQSLGIVVSSIFLGLVSTVFWRRESIAPVARAESRQ